MRAPLLNLARAVLGPARRARRRWFPTRFDRILAVHGWTQAVQLRYLMAQVRALPDPSDIVEVGVWQGRSALAMAEACRGTTKAVFAIDAWQDYDEGGEPIAQFLARHGVKSFEEVYQAFLHHRRRLALEPWVVVMRTSSLKAAAAWKRGPVALVFIDGDHHYEAVTADLAAWVPRVRPGGLICGDDWNWESVQAAVRDFTGRHRGYRTELPCANTWAFVKPPL